MSDQLKGTPQAPLDPEKGTLETLPPTLVYNQDVKTALDVFPASKEKDSAVTTTTKEVVVAAKKPAPKPKKKVSKWVLWRIWFNTYRYVVVVVILPEANVCRQEILHLHLWVQHDRSGFGSVRTLALWRQILRCNRRCQLQLCYLNAE
jgi:hypothetical protein